MAGEKKNWFPAPRRVPGCVLLSNRTQQEKTRVTTQNRGPTSVQASA
jgi:hypothetical protein